ncbi:alkaline phosphatase [Lipomyces arxii]|uniref:alkaline phosphatase n=1 Tax=Lipomyces arxii TaxID=56418 RepID=UPI0034CEC863
MGIPKFFRWISERYPLISQLIEGNKIPEFDNLYLDMNGILHNCTHKDTDDATFRISEDSMYIAIFAYIELLFEKVKPKKLFYMAIDGVAPRAKMNQQRSRRFRTALDAENARKKAIKDGTELPSEPPFDTNAITPGTDFMAKLSIQLDYFISKKVSEDSRWQNIEIILSGHEVPGEGEHKIMEYIRTAKVQPDYNPNTRHCLYGLDADLIMLGLLSHDPHFALLREEVQFGPSRTKPKELFHQKFFLLHLSLVREYLELEFVDIRNNLSFPFNFERVLDDFILLCIFVGNDFLPNLPQLEINQGALTFMFEAYKKALPHCDTYLTDSGALNLQNLRPLLKELVSFEFKLFEADFDDQLYIGQKSNPDGRKSKRNRHAMQLTGLQKMIFDSVEDFLVNSKQDHELKWQIPLSLVENELNFIETMASKLSIDYSIDASENGSVVSLNVSRDSSDASDEEADFALERVLQQYRSATVENSPETASATESEQVMKKFTEWKDKYYKEKLGFSFYDETKLKELCENYVQGLQWVLNYYYKGVCSWSWFFKYHYSPRVSDISKGLGADLNFALGQPFKPFEQLMGVLPDLSNKLIPAPYRELMHNPDSPILDFYPTEFELDLNGKKMDWEAVVKIPFVDQDRLLNAMKPLESQLTPAEFKRNSFGPMLKYRYSAGKDETYTSSSPFVFPDIEHNKCLIQEYKLPDTNGVQYTSYLCNGVLLGAQALAGFPTLKNIPHSAELTTRHSVNVFQQDSRREAIIVTLDNVFEDMTTEEVARKKIGSKIFVWWPYLAEARVVSVSDGLFSYSLTNVNGQEQVISRPHSTNEIQKFDQTASNIYRNYSRLGVDVGDVTVLISVALLSGLKQLSNGALVKHFDMATDTINQYAVQTTVESVVNEDERFMERPAPLIADQFPVGTRGFYLGPEEFAQPLQVLNIRDAHHADIYVFASQSEDSSFGSALALDERQKTVYLPAASVCRELNISGLLLSKITSSYSVTHGDQNAMANIGLNLKFEGKRQKVLGYTRRTESGWEYSRKAVRLIQNYMTTFPDLFRGITRALYTDRPDVATLLNIGEAAAAKKRFEQIRQWLKVNASDTSARVPLDTEQLLPETVTKIEHFVDNQVMAPPKMITIENVPQGSILKPMDAIHKLGHQTFALGDRVLYVGDAGNVPIATKGTLIGMTSVDGRKVLEVVFDLTFLGGSNLGDRCSADRGMTVEVYNVINMTTKQLAYKSPSKVGSAREGLGGGVRGGARGAVRGAVRGGARGGRGAVRNTEPRTNGK